MVTPPPVTNTFARFTVEADFAAISQKALANAKMHLLDTFGAALVTLLTPQ